MGSSGEPPRSLSPPRGMDARAVLVGDALDLLELLARRVCFDLQLPVDVLDGRVLLLERHCVAPTISSSAAICRRRPPQTCSQSS